MAKIKGFDQLQRQLKEMSKNVEQNAKSANGQLHIDTDAILKDLDYVNSLFNSSFTQLTSDDDFTSFFADSYQNIVADGMLEKHSQPKDIFNKKFSPFAWIE